MYVFHTATETEETLRWRACSEAVNSEDALAMKQPAPVPIQDQEGLLWLLIPGSLNSKTLRLREPKNSYGTPYLRITC